MVVRFGQVIPTGQAVETTEVVSQLDPRFRKVWPGMAGKMVVSSIQIDFSFRSPGREDGEKSPCGHQHARELVV